MNRSPSAFTVVHAHDRPPRFSPEALNTIVDPDNRETRARFKQHILDNRELFVPRFDIPLTEVRELAYARLKSVAKNKFFEVEDFEKNPLNVFAAHETLALVDSGSSTKMTVHLNLL